jgi:hypothetical protein
MSFNGTTLDEQFDLSGSNFTKEVYFQGAGFSSYAYFIRADFNDDSRFEGTSFRDYASFVGASFRKNAKFNSAGFSGVANFRDAHFSGSADFVEAIFNGKADFRWADFKGRADFGWTDFACLTGFMPFADFMSANFGSYVNFGFASFSGKANFLNTDFNGDANFDATDFNGDASFDDVDFNSDVIFNFATFTKRASFDEAEFNGNIEFGGARFENETSFYRILFKRPAYFEDSSIKRLNLTKAEYSRLHLRWDDIESLHFDEAAYLALIKNYNSLGWYGDANWCYYDYRNAVRRSWQAPSSGFAAKLSSLLDRLIDFGEWLLYGYGVRPSFPIAWSVGIILAFGLFFRQKRCLRKIIVEEGIEDSKDASGEVLIKTTARKAEINALDPILFSLFTFTSGFTAFLHPTIEYKLERCMRWAIVERLLGPFLMALVITAISKTYLIR